MDIDMLLENAIEITRSYYYFMEEGLLPHITEIDSREFSAHVTLLSKEFEENYKDVNFNESELDYYEEIELFTKDKMIKHMDI